MSATDLLTRWQDGRIAFGAVVRLGSAWMVESLARSGFDYLLFDCQHGLVADHELVPLLQVLNGSAVASLVKVSANDDAVIGRALDAGADGVIVPMVQTADDARRAVAACRYGPDGVRSYGTLRLQHLPGGANRRVLCIPLIETLRGVENCAQIAAVPGVDAVYVGPADLALSIGLPPKQGIEVEPLSNLIGQVRTVCAGLQVPTGIAGDATRMAPLGFQLVSAGTDATFFLAGLKAARRACLEAGGLDAGD